ncbi:MAG: sugar ABC transporter permease [Anaerolineae bacterium]|nr:sugar ABC transporter permease [Anaerolineae bacterium]
MSTPVPVPKEGGDGTVGAGRTPAPLARLSSWLQSAKAERYIGFVFVAPWVIAFLCFELIPTASAFIYSLTDWSIVGGANFIGLANYQEMFTRDRLFVKSLENTLYYALLSVPLNVMAGFIIALMLNAKVRGQTIFRTLFYLPALIPSVAGAVVWIWILDTNNGVLNFFLGLFGVEKIRWLTSPAWSKPALVIMSLWTIGSGMVIYLAGLQNVPQELYEAAEVDGASVLQKLLRITIPLMTPTIFFNLLMGIIGSFQVFNAAFIMTGGGPVNSTLFYMLHIYEQAFTHWRMGYASALSVVLFVLVLVLTTVVNRTSKRWVFYG